MWNLKLNVSRSEFQEFHGRITIMITISERAKEEATVPKREQKENEEIDIAREWRVRLTDIGWDLRRRRASSLAPYVNRPFSKVPRPVLRSVRRFLRANRSRQPAAARHLAPSKALGTVCVCLHPVERQPTHRTHRLFILFSSFLFFSFFTLTIHTLSLLLLAFQVEFTILEFSRIYHFK